MISASSHDTNAASRATSRALIPESRPVPGGGCRGWTVAVGLPVGVGDNVGVAGLGVGAGETRFATSAVVGDVPGAVIN
jgi:hypothetical protein